MPIHDYNQLHQFLSKQSWKDADIETRRLMLKIAEVEGRQDLLLTKSDIQKFPCTELREIDKLWYQASQGKFGFSVINKIYKSVNCDYSKLAGYVGWRSGENWIKYNQVNFTSDAPTGHLPLTWLVPTTFWMYWCSRFASAGWKLLFNRLEDCSL
ncbi:MAG: GUN4 domain-containing protein [Calothrix sp. MO_167.B12]|nr:GUN4 domain-containing protein [Calothrix sp. MO_167.B12]